MFHLYPKDFSFQNVFHQIQEQEQYFITSFLFYLPLCQVLVLFYNPSLRESMKKITFAWNVLLSVFSAIGAYYTVPFLWNCLFSESFDSFLLNQNPMCDYRLPPSVSFWSALFVYSKVPEFVDTFLYVLKNGKQHIFLHWYHHLATAMYSYYMMMRHSAHPQGIWMIALNYTVHAFMYAYYAVMEITERDNSFRLFLIRNSWFITTLQTTQMFIMLFILFYAGNLQGSFDWIGIQMYCIYAILFSKLFLEKYITKKRD